MITTVYLRRKTDNPQAQMLLARFQADGYQLEDLNIETVYRLEGISTDQVDALSPLLANPAVETFSLNTSLDLDEGPVFEVGYQRAVTDPELPSIFRGADALGVRGLEWARLSNRYQFIGVDAVVAKEIIHHYLYNPQVQVIMKEGETWDTLKPKGDPGSVAPVHLHALSDDELLTLSSEKRLFLNIEQMKALQAISDSMHRDLTDAEVEMFAQTWSDHCFHTTWKSLGLLKKLWDTTVSINHPLVLSVFEDNAGVMEFYDGWALTIKGETHNSPTAVSPYGGIMTKHGGVIRDTLGCGQGAKPIGSSTVMGLGDPAMNWKSVPQGALHPKTILLESIRGTADYCNPMGIPMMFPVYRFHYGYTGKCFALGHSIGLLPKDRASKGKPKPGDLAILIGGKTGMDGLHGATVSSDSMTSETSEVDATHVQIGHPIEERKFMEAIPILRDNDCLHAITDLGAAGLSSALGEMGENTGVWVNLACVPLKTEGMHPWEIWISESQERMMLCVPPIKLEETFRILNRFEVPASITGKFTESQRCQVIYDETKTENIPGMDVTPPLSGQVVIDLSMKDLRKGCPLPEMSCREPVKDTSPLCLPGMHTERDWENAIIAVLSHMNICDQSAAGHQFDNTVQGITAFGPYGGIDHKMPNDFWAATPLRGSRRAVVSSVAFNPFYGDVNAPDMARLMILEAVSKQVFAGVDPGDIVLCDNFYTPRADEAKFAWELKHMVEMCCDVSLQLQIPFISGKDSSNGTFIDADGMRIDVPSTLSVMAMGRHPDIRKIIPKAWNKAGNQLYLAGPLSDQLGGSVYLDTLGIRGSELPNPSVTDIQAFWKQLKHAQEKDWIESASALAEGGLIRRLFEMGFGSGLGCDIDLHDLAIRFDENQEIVALFSEMIGSAIIEVSSENAKDLESALSAVRVGEIINLPELKITSSSFDLSLAVSKLERAWAEPFRKVVA